MEARRRRIYKCNRSVSSVRHPCSPDSCHSYRYYRQQSALRPLPNPATLIDLILRNPTQYSAYGTNHSDFSPQPAGKQHSPLSHRQLARIPAASLRRRAGRSKKQERRLFRSSATAVEKVCCQSTCAIRNDHQSKPIVFLCIRLGHQNPAHPETPHRLLHDERMPNDLAKPEVDY